MNTDSPEPRPRPPKRRHAHATQPRSAEERRLAAELGRALQTDGLVLHYQPRFALETGLPVAAEALLRWPHRTHGLVPPRAILAAAKHGRLTEEVGGWVLLAACLTAVSWPGAPIGVSVNIAAHQLRDDILLHQVVHALERSGLPPDRLELEIPESILEDVDDDALLALATLRDLGIGVALDDFGAGRGSLVLLRTLPLSLLKLDRALVRGLPRDAADAALVDALVRAAHALGMKVAAEAVETEGQLGFLRGVGCDQGQGYLLGPAVPAAALTETLGTPDRPETARSAAVPQ